MSSLIIIFCGTTYLKFSKNDPVLTRLSEGYPPPNCQRKVKVFRGLKSESDPGGIGFAFYRARAEIVEKSHFWMDTAIIGLVH
jgi:hypothetical protein